MFPDIIKNILFVGCGSFLGGVARYIISVVMKGASKGFPWGTLLVNLAGCLFIGLLWGHFSKNCNECSSWYLFLTVGLCGGFTTFSTFSKEALTMASGRSDMWICDICHSQCHCWNRIGCSRLSIDEIIAINYGNHPSS